MTVNATLGEEKLERIEKGILLSLKRISGGKHRDLILVLSVILGFGMLFVFSAAG